MACSPAAPARPPRAAGAALSPRPAGRAGKGRRRSLLQDLDKKFSECGTAKKGGALGMFRRGKRSAAFERAAFNLAAHELSKTVASSSGISF